MYRTLTDWFLPALILNSDFRETKMLILEILGVVAIMVMCWFVFEIARNWWAYKVFWHTMRTLTHAYVPTSDIHERVRSVVSCELADIFCVLHELEEDGYVERKDEYRNICGAANKIADGIRTYLDSRNDLLDTKKEPFLELVKDLENPILSDLKAVPFYLWRKRARGNRRQRTPFKFRPKLAHLPSVG